LDDALVIWRAREVHRVLCFFYGLAFVLFLLDWLTLMVALGGFWGTLMVAFHVAMFWGLWRLLCWVVGWLMRRASTMVRWLPVVLVTLLLTGCYPMAVEMNRLVGLDCSQAALQQNQGRCVTAAKKGE
jgi:hypothetical protein